MRSVVRTLIAVLLAGFCPVLVTASAQASVQQVQQRSAGTGPAGSHPLTISIDSVSPQFATPTTNVTVTGTLSNHTGSAIPSIVLQAQTAYHAFDNRSEMTAFSGSGEYPYELVQAALNEPSASVANGATVRWTISFPAGSYYDGFGVYPILVQAASTAGTVSTAQTFLPFWPGNDSVTRPTALQVAWVWPLIDTPQQGACPQVLATSSLAQSLTANGRLGTLLGTGAQWAARDDLTWAIDPALLSDATVMTHPYFTGGNATCTGRTAHDTPSAAAASWLHELAADTAGEPAFATPYADVDVSALSHAGLDADLRSAYQVGNATAAKILPSTFGAANGSGGAGTELAAAWPAGGTADAGVLKSLAADGGIRTVVLSSNETPTSAPYYDNALARTTTSSGTSMSVLLADADITTILASASAASSTATRFAATQDFLAQTAMILAEAPNLSRSLVVAPPAGWHPSAAEAADLLRLTKAAPWLHVTGLGTLAAQAGKATAVKLPARRVSPAELSDQYLDQLGALDTNLSLYKNLLSQPSPGYLSSFDTALAVTESAAWRGSGSPGGWLAMTQLNDFLASQEGEVQLIASKKVLLAGTTGTTPVSVTNGLNFPIQIQVRAFVPAGSTLKVGSGSFERVLTVDPHTSSTVRMPLSSSSAFGTTTMQLQLFTRNGTPLTGLKASASMSVEVTRFGRTLLIIIAGALGLLVLTTIVRLRRKRRAAGRPGGADDQADDRTVSSAHAGGGG